MNLNQEQAQKFIEAYERGEFKFEPPHDKEVERTIKQLRLELAHPTEKNDDDPNAVFVPMGYAGFTTSLSQSPRLKTTDLGSCLALVASGKSLAGLTNQTYNGGSLSHVAATLDTDGLVALIVARNYMQGIFPDAIDFEIHATDSVDKRLLAETKRAIYNRTGQRGVKEDVRMIHSTSLLYDFSDGRVYEIPQLDLSLPEYKKPLMIPPPHSPYRVVKDPRIEMDLGKMCQLYLSGFNNTNIKQFRPSASLV